MISNKVVLGLALSFALTGGFGGISSAADSSVLTSVSSKNLAQICSSNLSGSNSGTSEGPGGADASLNERSGSKPSHTSTAPPNPPESVTSINQEKSDAKKQIDMSAPASSHSSPLPAGGKVVATKEQKQEAVNESVSVLSHGRQPTIPARNSQGRPTVCLALGGGGARGAAHIGVIRVFEREGIPIDYIVGNSMGSVVGGMYAAGMPLSRIEQLCEDGSLRHAYMPSSILPTVVFKPISSGFNVFKKHYAGLYSGNKFTNWLDASLPEPSMNVQDTKIPFSAVATNLLDGRAYRISEGRLSTVLKASSALSPLIQPVPIGDKLYVDGGVRANLPGKAARETGAGVVIAVLVDEPLGKVPPKRFMHFQGIASRMVDIVLATADERQMQFTDVVINPDVSDIPILSKRQSDVEKAIRSGEAAAEKALPAIRAAMAHPKTPASVASSAKLGIE